MYAENDEFEESTNSDARVGHVAYSVGDDKHQGVCKPWLI